MGEIKLFQICYEGDLTAAISSAMRHLGAEPNFDQSWCIWLESGRHSAALVRFLWKAAPHLTLCHDVGHAGLEHALAEAAEWSGRPADVSLPDEPGYGAAVLAVPRNGVAGLGSKGFVQIGEVR